MFINVQGRLINTKYIKEIARDLLIVANTEAITMADESYNYKVREDRRISISPEEYQSIKEQLDYPKIIMQLKQENERLMLELQYRPGGTGYEAAKTEFELLK